MNHTSVHPSLQQIHFKIGIITLSDRASKGVYPDLSGETLQQLLGSYFEERQLKITFDYHLIPDDAVLLHEKLRTMIDQEYHYIFTTGSTGIGPRDIAPDTVRLLLDKEIPGIMEYIRVKYGAQIPNALLSRSLAGISQKTILYTLPGSPKAVKEYLNEIFNTLLHCYLMATSVDAH